MPSAVSEAEILTIYRDTIDGLYAFVSRRCLGDRALAEDITQDTWLRAVRAWRRDGLPDRPAAWLMTVSGNLLANHFRRRQPASFDDSLIEGLELAIPDSDDDSTARADAVRKALARLPLRRSRLLEAFYFDGKRTAELASALGVSERAIEGRLRRAREQLRREVAATYENGGELT